MADRITIFDTTLRDGEQAPGFSLTVNEKLQLARQLDALGVDVIEAGFPIASEADAEAVRVVATHVKHPSCTQLFDTKEYQLNLKTTRTDESVTGVVSDEEAAFG